MKKRLSVFVLLSILTFVSHATTYYPAQILGRQLGIKGLGWAGHVGLTIAEHFSDTAHQIIEVLNEIEVIQVNTIEHFKQTTRYWGSRYGIADHTEAADVIVKEALRQRALCPIYTDSATYHIGQGTPDNPTRCAVFRCDTFINYLFHHAGYTLPTYRGKTLPKYVFKAFPKSHEDGDIILDVPLDNFKQAFDLPASQVTPQSIQTSWMLAQNPNLSDEKRLFLLDYLGLNGTPELLSAFIQYYPTQTNSTIKSMLIRSTFTLYQKYFLNQPHTELQQFYQKLLDKPLDTRDVPFVIRGFIQLSNTQQKYHAENKLHQLLKAYEKTLPNETYRQLKKLVGHMHHLFYTRAS